MTRTVIRVDTEPGGAPAHATIDALTIVDGGGQIMLPPSDASTAGHTVGIAASDHLCTVICHGADRLFGSAQHGVPRRFQPANTPAAYLTADGAGGWW